MPKRKYNILIADDDELVNKMLCRVIGEMGHIPISFKSGNQAINYLRCKERGIQNYLTTAMIISDLRMEDGDGYSLLRERNKLDPQMPFYLFSGVATPDDTDAASKLDSDGYIKKPRKHELMLMAERMKEADGHIPKSIEGIVDEIKSLVSNTLIEKIDLKKPAVMFKIGGSADDFDEEKEGEQLAETIDFFVQIQKEGAYQVILTTGAGKRGDLIKKRLLKYGMSRREIREGYPYKINEALVSNMKDVRDIASKENAVYITPYQMSGREPLYLPDFGEGAPKPWRMDNIQRLFNQDKVIIISSAPRHLGMGHPEVTLKKHIHYPNIPMEDSDSQTVLLAEMFGVKTLGLIKRTDDIYKLDPYYGFMISSIGKANFWPQKQSRKKNRALSCVSYKDLLDPEKVSRKGAFDMQGGHLFEDSGLKLFGQSETLEKIAVAHISPYELYYRGIHVVQKKRKPLLPEREVREARIREIIQGTDYACIIK